MQARMEKGLSTGASTTYTDITNAVTILCAATFRKMEERMRNALRIVGSVVGEPAYISNIVAMLEQINAKKSEIMKALKANFLAKVGVPPFWWSSALLPPGMVKAAANVTVAISTEAIARLWVVLSYFFSSFSGSNRVFFSSTNLSSRR